MGNETFFWDSLKISPNIRSPQTCGYICSLIRVHVDVELYIVPQLKPFNTDNILITIVLIQKPYLRISTKITSQS